MILQFLRFYFNRSTRNGVALRKSVKAAMPKPKVKPKVEISIPDSLRKGA